MVKCCKKGKKLRLAGRFSPLEVREREVCGHARQQLAAGVEPNWRSQARIGFPLFGVTDGWASVGI
jgi:hypothetical protein